MKNAHQWELEENSWRWNNIGGFIKDAYCSWVRYKSGLEAVDMNGRFQMQGGKNWILPK